MPENWKILTQKNFKVFARNPKYCLFFFLTPIFLITIIQLFQFTYDRQLSRTTQVETSIDPISPVIKCPYPSDCISIGYSIVGQHETWIDDVMRLVATRNNMEFKKDVQLLTQGTAQDFNDYIHTHPNKTQVAVVFCTDSWDIQLYNNTFNIPCKFGQLEEKK